MLYKEALNPEKNNAILQSQGMPEIFGRKFRTVQKFEKGVVLYSLEQEKIAEGQFINVIRQRTYYGCSPETGFFLDNELQGLNDSKVCFASLEYAKSVMDTLDSLYRKKVGYEGKEYFVIDYLSPYEVGLHEEDTDDYRLSDLAYVRLDELEF